MGFFLEIIIKPKLVFATFPSSISFNFIAAILRTSSSGEKLFQSYFLLFIVFQFFETPYFWNHSVHICLPTPANCYLSPHFSLHSLLRSASINQNALLILWSIFSFIILGLIDMMSWIVFPQNSYVAGLAHRTSDCGLI